MFNREKAGECFETELFMTCRRFKGKNKIKKHMNRIIR